MKFSKVCDQLLHHLVLRNIPCKEYQKVCCNLKGTPSNPFAWDHQIFDQVFEYEIISGVSILQSSIQIMQGN